MLGYSNTQPIELCWDDAKTGPNPSLYIDYVHGTPFAFNKYAYNSASTIYSSNGFASSSADITYPNCVTLPAKTTPRFIRVIAFYNDVTLYIVPKGGAALPSQGYLVSSTGQVNSVKKTIRAIKTFPTIPINFDFTIFSTSDENPLQN